MRYPPGVPLALCALAATACARTPAPRSDDQRSEPASLVWEGAVRHAGAPLDVTIVLRADSAGGSGTIDARDLYALDYPLQNVRLRGDSVHFELPDLLPPGAFDGLRYRGRIVGAFRGVTDAADSVRGSFELWRRPPKSTGYATEELEFRNGDVTLDGTLMLPPGPGPHPAVIFLHGSGPQTRDSYVRFFADHFARRGVAALIYDKRNTRRRPDLLPYLRGGGSFVDHAGDAVAAVRVLTARRDIDRARIGLWGLSQGAWLAPLAASRAAGDVAFVVMLSGGGVTPARQELYDDEVRLRARGFSDGQISDALILLRHADAYVRSGSDADWTRFAEARDAAQRQPWFRVLDRFPLVLPREAPAWAGLRADLDYDPRPALERLRVPVLVILGEADELTPTRETAEEIADALERARNQDHRIVIVPRADHALTVRGSASAPDWRRPAPGWIDEMTGWVTTHAGGGRRAGGGGP
jgi:dienelactone hydrolase